MTIKDIDKHLIAFHEAGNDYRFAFTREEVQEIKEALLFKEGEKYKTRNSNKSY